MNTILSYLSENWQRLNLSKYGAPGDLSSNILTPGFQASSHLIVFVMTKAQQDPILVVKLPRISGDHHRLDLEAANLRKLHATKTGGYDSIPRVVAYEDWKNYRLLVETMVKGRIMRPPLVRKNTEGCIQGALNWLNEIGRKTAVCSYKVENWFRDLAENRLDAFAQNFPMNPDEKKLLAKTRELIEPLRHAKIPLVFEHGDFSSPNILLEDTGKLGVVDWELAETHGLPAADFIFFLTYIAFSKEKALQQRQQLSAFQNAFLHQDAWAIPYLQKYCEKLDVPQKFLKPLFILSWARYVSNMVLRLKGENAAGNELSRETTDWFRENRFYLIWKQAVIDSGKISA